MSEELPSPLSLQAEWFCTHCDLFVVRDIKKMSTCKEADDKTCINISWTSLTIQGYTMREPEAKESWSFNRSLWNLHLKLNPLN